ncbi:hypothetical protein FZC66_14250 [Priestia megaterium]|nr:hypothetical protein FZC66_14250 [Priestia megaterium]
MGMRYENIKTIILFILVAISLVLTWNLWSYQPSYDVITDTQYLQEVEAGEKSNPEEHIRPTKVLYHKNNNHFLSHEEADITKWIEEMKTWELSDITDVSSVIEQDEFLEYVHSNNAIEILYPDLLPVETFQRMFKFTDDKLPTIDFDRVLIKIKRTPTLSASVYFVNYNQHKLYAVKVKNFMKEDIRDLEDMMASSKPCIVYKKNPNRYIFLPQNEVKMKKVYAYDKMLDIEKFQKALFTKPEYVRKETLPYRELYTEGTKVINVNTRTNVMEYVNLVNSSNEVMEESNLLNRSFSFVNDHAGWTEPNYRFDSWNRVTKEITYRYYQDNYPVYSNQGMAEIYQRWGNAEILNYRRPLYRFVQVTLPNTEETLQPGQDVISIIENHQDFDPALLKDISIGYQLEEGINEEAEKTADYDSNSVTLIPSWFYYYNNKWYQVTLPAERSLNDGLE